jgi:predicted GH43/DUF377 family glycosyl hydrolase
MTGFELASTEALTLACRSRLTNMYVLSPFVWRDASGGYEMLLRAVPRRDDQPRLKMAEIWYGRSTDGLNFEMDIAPTLFPGPEVADLDGCEDPTVVVDKAMLHIWYTGWNQRQLTGRLLHAAGPDARHLSKLGVALDSTASYANPKEATVVACADGRWRLLFEFARDEASRIGMAVSDELAGPWTIEGAFLEPRPERFDSWHLSPGPIIGAGSDGPIMFYNGATRDAHWRIGWIQFDSCFHRVVDRCQEPLIIPSDLVEGATDIAFAASALEFGDHIWLYYSIADMDLHRATLTLLSPPDS